MRIDNQIDVLIKGRALLLKLIDGFTIEQINTIPDGFQNNIGWNVAHVVVTQQLLCYKLSGLAPKISDDMIDKYRKGTTPNGTISKEEWEQIKQLLLELPKSLQVDYDNQLFKNYTNYTTSVEVTLDSVEKAIDFNNFHEGIHLGVILGLRKLV